MLSKILCLLIIFFVLQLTGRGQDQKVADSLRKIYQEKKMTGSEEMEILQKLSFNEVGDPYLSLYYSDELIRLSKKSKNNKYLHSGYFQRGDKRRWLGDFGNALEAYFKCVEIASKGNLIRDEANDYNAIAGIYFSMYNYPFAITYYRKAISIFREVGDSITLAAAINNAGVSFLDNKDYDSALVYFTESKNIYKKKNFPVGEAHSISNTGLLYASLGKYDSAIQSIEQAISILEKKQNYLAICTMLGMMSDIYLKKGNEQKALDYALESLTMAQQFGYKKQISDASLKISQLYEKSGKIAESFEFYKNYIKYRDSAVNPNSERIMADLRTNYEVSKKEAQVELLSEQKQNQRIMMTGLFVILGLAIAILVILYRYYRNISAEKAKAESLLLNILPAETAMELEQNGKIEAQEFDEVTVLFTDFVSFSQQAEKVNPDQLVKSIDYYFRAFDEISTKYKLEKIKTIGDSYMCACGLPTPNPVHAKQIISAAKEMIAVVNEELEKQDGLNHFEIRIGVNTGPVVAGIVGIKKWQYDIWGDTVNIASRMEVNSIPGKVNLSETTYLKIKDEFPCEYRGEFKIKNHGSLKMYFLS